MMGPGLPWWAWTMIALGSLIVILLIILLASRQKPAVASNNKVDRNKAYMEAQKEIQDASKLQPREAATNISSALRRYMTTIFGDPTLYETHEEYLSRHEALSCIPESSRLKVSELFSELASFKYKRPTESDDSGFAIDKPLSLLKEIHQVAPA